MKRHEYIQFGCGMSAPGAFGNYDASPTLWFERLPLLGRFYTKNSSRFPENVIYGDITKGLPIRDGSCKGVYCSHVLEHLSLEELRIALRNVYRMLAEGGTFRLVLPDLELSMKKYMSSSSPEAAGVFLRTTSLGTEKRHRGLKGLASVWLGNSHHLWMWDYKALAAELKTAGFVQVRRAYFGDSSDPVFLQVEEESRWKDGLGIECQKNKR